MSKNKNSLDPQVTITNNVLLSLRKIIQSIALNSKSLFKRVGLTGPQLMVLREVTYSDEISVGEVAKAISLSQATVSGIMQRMEKKNLIIRRRDDVDRRRVMVKLTAAGYDLLKKAPPLMQEEFVSRFNGLSDWEQTMILSALQRLVSIMDAKSIDAAPILATGPIEEAAQKE